MSFPCYSLVIPLLFSCHSPGIPRHSPVILPSFPRHSPGIPRLFSRDSTASLVNPYSIPSYTHIITLLFTYIYYIFLYFFSHTKREERELTLSSNSTQRNYSTELYKSVIEFIWFIQRLCRNGSHNEKWLAIHPPFLAIHPPFLAIHTPFLAIHTPFHRYSHAFSSPFTSPSPSHTSHKSHGIFSKPILRQYIHLHPPHTEHTFISYFINPVPLHFLHWTRLPLPFIYIYYT